MLRRAVPRPSSARRFASRVRHATAAAAGSRRRTPPPPRGRGGVDLPDRPAKRDSAASAPNGRVRGLAAPQAMDRDGAAAGAGGYCPRQTPKFGQAMLLRTRRARDGGGDAHAAAACRRLPRQTRGTTAQRSSRHARQNPQRGTTARKAHPWARRTAVSTNKRQKRNRGK